MIAKQINDRAPNIHHHVSLSLFILAEVKDNVPNSLRSSAVSIKPPDTLGFVSDTLLDMFFLVNEVFNTMKCHGLDWFYERQPTFASRPTDINVGGHDSMTDGSRHFDDPGSEIFEPQSEIITASQKYFIPSPLNEVFGNYFVDHSRRYKLRSSRLHSDQFLDEKTRIKYLESKSHLNIVNKSLFRLYLYVKWCEEMAYRILFSIMSIPATLFTNVILSMFIFYMLL